MDIAYQNTNRTFRNNAFFGHAPLSPGSNAVTVDPQFINAAGAVPLPAGQFFTIEAFRAAVAAFQIHNGSPLRDAGLSVDNNGGMDFWGNMLYEGAADIGAHEYLTASALPPQTRRRRSPAVTFVPAVVLSSTGSDCVLRVVDPRNSSFAMYDFRGRKVYDLTGGSFFHEASLHR